MKKKKKVDETVPVKDELEEYLADTDVPDYEDPVLDWWKVKAHKWPALGKMVKQYFAVPASSAGVERVSQLQARCMATCKSRPRTLRSSTRSLQHSIRTKPS